MLQQDQPDDYVIATGKAHSVKEFVQRAFQTVGLDWQKFMKIDKRFQRPLDVAWIAGDYSHAVKKAGLYALDRRNNHQSVQKPESKQIGFRMAYDRRSIEKAS